MDGARAGLVSAGGDPYTIYLDAAQAKVLSDDLDGQLSGIGAQIAIKNNILTVVAPVPGTPADKAGLRPGDVIEDINNQDTTTMGIDVAVAKIRGKADTNVTLKIARSGAPAAFNVTITRANIQVPSVNWSVKDGNIGYIRITTFGSDTADLMDKAATQLVAQGAKKIILDLRNNGGGYLTAGVSVANEFLPAGKTIVTTRDGDVVTDSETAKSGGQLVGLPTIVLVNVGSASASEIVAGALHDNGAAKLLGETTFGKGSVQDIINLSGGAELKVTVAHWYTPGGININKAGLKPDIAVALTTADYNASQDPQLAAALQQLK